VNPDKDSGSLADRAAAWVPPWERPTDRDAPDERSGQDVETDPETLDAAAELDREIDADIVRETGLPGPGTVESGADDTEADVAAEADIERTEFPADAIAEPADRDIEANGVGAASDAEPDTEPDIEPDTEPDIESDAATGLGTESAADVAASASADVAASAAADGDIEADVDGRLEPGEGSAAEPDRDASLAGPLPSLAPVPSPLPGLAGAELGGALEAILMVVDEPVTEAHLADVLDVAPEDVADRLQALAAEYAESARGFELRRSAGGWRFYTRGEYSTYVERFVLDGQSARLTQAALETLAVVAYQQPVTRSRISAIRGVNCDGVVRTLVTRGLLEESGTQPETGAYLYRTTTLFLEKLGLDSVDELPPLAPFLPDDVNGLTDAQR
jgi:segregation and condensation protein B